MLLTTQKNCGGGGGARSEVIMEIGIDSFAANFDDRTNAASDNGKAMAQLLERIEQADEMGLDVFGIGEHHRKEFLDSAPAIILAALSLVSPFMMIPGVTLGYSLVLCVMHIVAALSLLYFIRRAKQTT